MRVCVYVCVCVFYNVLFLYFVLCWLVLVVDVALVCLFAHSVILQRPFPFDIHIPSVSPMNEQQILDFCAGRGNPGWLVVAVAAEVADER